jgi:uncharacterized membrane protein
MEDKPMQYWIKVMNIATVLGILFMLLGAAYLYSSMVAVYAGEKLGFVRLVMALITGFVIALMLLMNYLYRRKLAEVMKHGNS